MIYVWNLCLELLIILQKFSRIETNLRFSGGWSNYVYCLEIVWMKSIECQINETEVGDMYAVDTVFVDIPAVKNSSGEYHYQKGAGIVTFSPALQHCAKDIDYEKPWGEWNTVEIYTVKGKSVHVINGKVNLRIRDARYLKNGKEVVLDKGKIQLQSEGSEIYYRNITLMPIDKIPDDLL